MGKELKPSRIHPENDALSPSSLGFLDSMVDENVLRGLNQEGVDTTQFRSDFVNQATLLISEDPELTTRVGLREEWEQLAFLGATVSSQYPNLDTEAVRLGQQLSNLRRTIVRQTAYVTGKKTDSRPHNLDPVVADKARLKNAVKAIFWNKPKGKDGSPYQFLTADQETELGLLESKIKDATQAKEVVDRANDARNNISRLHEDIISGLVPWAADDLDRAVLFVAVFPKNRGAMVDYLFRRGPQEVEDVVPYLEWLVEGAIDAGEEHNLVDWLAERTELPHELLTPLLNVFEQELWDDVARDVARKMIRQWRGSKNRDPIRTHYHAFIASYLEELGNQIGSVHLPTEAQKQQEIFEVREAEGGQESGGIDQVYFILPNNLGILGDDPNSEDLHISAKGISDKLKRMFASKLAFFKRSVLANPAVLDDPNYFKMAYPKQEGDILITHRIKVAGKYRILASVERKGPEVIVWLVRHGKRGAVYLSSENVW